MLNVGPVNGLTVDVDKYNSILNIDSRWRHFNYIIILFCKYIEYILVRKLQYF